MNPSIHYLKLFYDPYCGLCRDFKKWVEDHPAYFPVSFVPYNSEEALKIFPRLYEYRGDEEIIALSDHGYYQGAEAWIMTLYALKDYREIAMKFAHPAMIKKVKPFCHWVSKNRKKISSVLEWFESEEEVVSCEGNCRIKKHQKNL